MEIQVKVPEVSYTFLKAVTSQVIGRARQPLATLPSVRALG